MKKLITGLSVVALALGVLGASAPSAPVAAQTNPSAIDVAPVLVQKCCTADGTHQIIGGQSWAVGDEIELFINGSYVATSIAEPNAEGSASPFFDSDAVGIYLDPGDVVTLALSDGSRTETHVVTALSVSRMDVATDTVTGSTEPGSEVVVFIPNTTIFRSETADGQGDWIADFSVPGDQPGEEDVVDIGFLTLVAVAQFDAGGSATLWQTSPGEYAPIIVGVDGADLFGFSTGPQVVTGQSWPGGVAVDLFLNGVYVATSITDWNAEGSASPFFDLAALGFTVVAGDEVTLALSDGSRTETHIVTGVSLTLVDIAADTVAGTAERGSLVFVGTVAWLSDSPQANLLVTTNEAGEWLADFSSMVDLVPATVGQAGQWDNSGNFTTLLWAPELTSKDQCKKGGWQDFGFKNQGQCVSSIARQT